MPDEIMLEARQLTRRFGDLCAVNQLTLQVARGEIYGLVGPDGAGKTTTVRLFCGLMDPDEGEALVAGLNPTQQVHAVRDRIGYMPQRFGLYVDLSVEENLYFFADLYGMTGSARDKLMTELLRMTRMEPFRKRLAGNLSGGMKQKLALMSTLLHKPDVLFLDEPTNGVDPVSRRDFWEILYRLVRDGLTVLLTTAYLDEAERCHRIGLMNEGRLIREGTLADLRTSIDAPCYRIHSSTLRDTLHWLRAQTEVMAAEFSGSAIHAFLPVDRQQREGLLARLQGVGVDDVRQIQPSLEDVFVATVGRSSGNVAYVDAGSET